MNGKIAFHEANKMEEWIYHFYFFYNFSSIYFYVMFFEWLLVLMAP